MKKLINYVILMLIVVIVIPFIIVRGCSHGSETKEEDIPEEVKEDLVISVLMHKENEIKKMQLEEYLKGALAAEMPVEFGLEALKAQAVAARTYIYSRYTNLYGPSDDSHMGADICTSSAHCLAWISKDDAMKKWSIFSAGRNWAKISRAVNETHGIILTYEGKAINSLFHSNSGGRTENSEEVWEGVSVPYLRSVSSMEKEDTPAFSDTVELKVEDFIDILKSKYPDIEIDSSNIMSDITVLEYSEGGRVKSFQVGNVTMKGTEFRTLFGLRSANFSIQTSSAMDTLQIATTGYGHGVGMSQWGADYLSKVGWDFSEILKHYYTGVKLEDISNLEGE